MDNEIDYDFIKYEVAADKIEQLNKDLLEHEIYISRYEEQKEIKEYNSYRQHRLVIDYLELTILHQEISHKIGQLKKDNEKNPNIKLLLNKAKSIKDQIKVLKEYEVVNNYLDILKNIRVRYYLSEIKQTENIKKQISYQENRMSELNKKVRTKILIKKD